MTGSETGSGGWNRTTTSGFGDHRTAIILHRNKIGSPGWARSSDQQINSLLLYQLSYWGIKLWRRDRDSNSEAGLRRPMD